MKRCDICGQPFSSTKPNKLRCSKNCVRKYHLRWMSKYYSKKPKRTRKATCVQCANDFINSGTVNRKTCSKECSRFQHLKRVKKYNLKSRERQVTWMRSERRKEWLKVYREKNMKTILEKQRAYKKSNPQARLYGVLRTTLGRRIKCKGRTSRYLDYTPTQLRNHIEKQFREGMSWKNYGRKGWHIDHVRPLNSFKFFDEKGNVIKKEVSKAMSLENLQPLWAVENIRKSDRFEMQVAI